MKTLNPDFTTYRGISIFNRGTPQSHHPAPFVSVLSRDAKYEEKPVPEGYGIDSKTWWVETHTGGEETLEVAQQVIDAALEGKPDPVVRHAIMRRYLGSPLVPVELVKVEGGDGWIACPGGSCSKVCPDKLAPDNCFYEPTPENLERVRKLHHGTQAENVMDVVAQLEQEMEAAKISKDVLFA